MGTETPYLSGVFRFVARLHTLSRRGMRMALAGQPKCRYGMLQSLYNLIEQHGCDGAIYVSDIARQMHQPMPAISRGLRQMEQDGHIVRETDPKDRRKTLVRITPAGERARKTNEQAMNDYFARIMARLTPEQLAQKFNAAFDEFRTCDGVVVLSDLPGGSPFKTAVECKYARPDQKIEVIAGTNLPMIVTAVTMLDMEDDPRSLAEELVDTGKDCMVIFELQAPAEEAESDESDGI